MKGSTLNRYVMAAIGFSAAVGLILGQTKIVKKPIEYASPEAGADMYQKYCASCHGAGGKGNGPAAAALSKPVTDLTMLAKNNNGTYPAFAVMEVLTKGDKIGVHGSADMPLWGDVFRTSGQSETESHLRVYNLMRYIEIIQVPAEKVTKVHAKSEPAPKFVRDIAPSSGSDMYRWYCSSCHGATGKGDGPSAASLKAKPIDLTLLAKNNNGSFPAMKLSNDLGAAPGTTAHGSKEMPIWGDAFRAAHEDNNIVQMRIHNIVEYLKSIQQ